MKASLQAVSAARRARGAAQGGLAFKFGAELRRCRKDASAPGFRKRS